MKKRYYKFITVLLVVALLFAFCSPCCFADSEPQRLAAYSSQQQRFAALVGAALSALNITLNSISAPVQDAFNFLSDPLGIVYTYPEAQLDDYFNQSTIQIWDDYVEIDGVRYSDVWLSHDVAEKMRVNAGDLETAWNISSNSNGTYASGYGEFDGVPVFEIDGQILSRQYLASSPGTYAIADHAQGILTRYTSSTTYAKMAGYGYDLSPILYNNSELPLVFQVQNNFMSMYPVNRPSGIKTIRISDEYRVHSPFEYTWTSGQIPIDPIPDSDTGLRIRVPSDSVQQFVDDHPQWTQPGGIHIDPDLLPDIDVELHDLLDILAPIIPLINTGDIVWEKNHDDPTPPTPGSIAETPWSQLVQQFDRVINNIQSIPGTIIPSISNARDSIVSSITSVGDSIESAIDNLDSTISGLGDTILQDIEKGPIQIFDKGIDFLKTLLLPFLNLLRGALGIWHYVVDWMGAISVPFQWILACTSSTPILAPVYASIAGAIVIAIYRRFGR